MSETVFEPEGQQTLPDAAPAVARPEDVPFFLVGVPKFIVMTLLTFGVYQLYWWYRHWARLRAHGGEDVWPWLRTIFANLFAYYFFDRVNEEADRQGTPTLVSPLLLAAAYFVALTCGYLGAPEWVPFLAPVALLAYVQSVINALPAARALPRSDRNTRVTLKNAGAIVALFAGLVVVYSLDEETPPPPPDAIAAFASAVDEINRQLPQTISGGMTLERVETNPDGIGLFVRLTQVDARTAIAANVVGNAQRQLLEIACGRESFQRFAIERGVPVRYTIVDQAHTAFASLHVTTPAQCGALGE